MKIYSLYISLFVVSLSLFSCVEDDVSSLVDQEEELEQVPVAVNDELFVLVNTPLKFDNLLENDTIYEYGRISSVDISEGIGELTPNCKGSYIYTPEEDFVGETSFTYELCDENLPANCSTGTVTVYVTEELLEFGASDDFVVVTPNTTLVIDNLLANDLRAGDAIIESIDTTSTIGSAEVDGNVVTYVPATDFTGDDSLTYEICSTLDGTQQCATATIYITVSNILSFNLDTNVSGYYGTTEFFENSSVLLETLQSLTEDSHDNILEYIDRHDYLYDADADMTNADNVILIYSSESRFEEEYQGNGSFDPQTFNTEHVYPQSFLVTDSQSISDLHLLRACDASINSSRSNDPFVAGSGTYERIGNGWYPGDEWIGDVARIVMYVHMYYDEPFEDVGDLELFLEWNAADPVSEFEKQRNDVIEGAQGNRNPFIDNPYLATLIWGGDAAENTWE